MDMSDNFRVAPAPVQAPHNANSLLPDSIILNGTRLMMIFKTNNGSESNGNGNTESLQDERREIENPTKRSNEN